MKKRFLGITLFCLSLFTIPILANAQNFLTAISDAQANLTAEQTAKLATLRANPIYESVIMVQVGDLPSLQKDGVLNINIPGRQAYNAVAYRIENPSRTSTGDFTWEGAFFKDTVIGGVRDSLGDGNAIFHRKNGQIYGTIDAPFSTDFYELSSFETGKNVLIKYSAAAENSQCSSEPLIDATPAQRVTSNPCNTKVRVLFEVTAAGGNAVTNIVNLVDQIMGDLNGAVYNSDLSNANLSFELAGITGTSWVEDPNTSINANRNNAQAYTNIHLDRDQYAADIVVILTDGNWITDNGNGSQTRYYGTTTYIGPNDDQSYALVEADFANYHYMLSHEIGHLFGARHQQKAITNVGSPDDTPGDAHGFRMVRKAWFSKNTNYITIMHELNGVDRSHLFSTPDRQIWGHDMGTADGNNNTRVLLSNSCTVASFRPDNAISFTATMAADRLKAPTGGTVNLVANTNNVGYQPYTYRWTTSTDGFNWTTLPNTTSSIVYNMPSDKRVYVYCDVCDIYGLCPSANKTLNNSDYTILNPYQNPDHMGNIPPHRNVELSESSIFTVSPNPANSEVRIDFGYSDNKNSTLDLKIVDALGRTVFSKKVSSNDMYTVVDVKRFQKGLYIIKLEGGKTLHTAKLTLID